MMNMATIVLDVVIVAVVSKSLRVLLYNGCCRMLEAAVAKLASMHHTTNKLFFSENAIPGEWLVEISFNCTDSG